MPILNVYVNVRVEDKIQILTHEITLLKFNRVPKRAYPISHL